MDAKGKTISMEGWAWRMKDVEVRGDVCDRRSKKGKGGMEEVKE